MTILFILEYYHPHTGGVETFFQNLVAELDRKGHRVVIITNRYEADLAAQEVDGNVEIRRYRFFNRYMFTFFAWIVALVPAGRADIIHTTSYNAALPSWLVAKLRGKKTIITFHEVWSVLWGHLPWMSGIGRKLHRSFEKMICNLHFDRFVGVSDYTRNALIEEGISPDRAVRIYNGIQYPSMVERDPSHTENDPFVFMFYGRVSYSKGVDILLLAVKELMRKDVNFVLKMVIPSESTPLLKIAYGLIEEYGVKELIEIKHDLPYEVLLGEIAKADAIVIPSYSEGFCFAAVETMAIGTPIISSDQGALKEVISGRFIKLESLDAKLLADAMIEAISGRWSHTPLVRFPLSDTIDQYLALYEQVLQE